MQLFTQLIRNSPAELSAQDRAREWNWLGPGSLAPARSQAALLSLARLEPRRVAAKYNSLTYFSDWESYLYLNTSVTSVSCYNNIYISRQIRSKNIFFPNHIRDWFDRNISRVEKIRIT